jgi:hypothetical protein
MIGKKQILNMINILSRRYDDLDKGQREIHEIIRKICPHNKKKVVDISFGIISAGGREECSICGEIIHANLSSEQYIDSKIQEAEKDLETFKAKKEALNKPNMKLL